MCGGIRRGVGFCGIRRSPHVAELGQIRLAVLEIVHLGGMQPRVFAFVHLAVEQQLCIRRHLDIACVRRLEQRLPTFLRQIPLLRAGFAIAGESACEIVHLLVACIAGVTLNPAEAHFAGPLAYLRIDCLDDRRVLHRFLFRVLPAVLLPPEHPFARAVDGILRVGFYDQRLASRVCTQRLEHCAQFADLIRAVRGAPCRTIARMRVFVARAVRMVGPRPPHRAVRITQCGAICGNCDRHASTLRAGRYHCHVVIV